MKLKKRKNVATKSLSNFYGRIKMKPKSILLAAALALIAASTATVSAAEERRADVKAGQAETLKAEKPAGENPVKSDHPMKEKINTPAGVELDFKELFGCMPMEDKTNMPPPAPASGESKPGPMKPMQEK